MMKKEEFSAYFETHLSEMQTMIFRVALWADRPEKDTCKAIRDGLYALAKAGNNDAAAMYVLIEIYNNHEYTFSEEVSAELLFAADALDTYHALLEETFDGILDEETYADFYAYPAVLLMKKAAAGQDEAAE